MSKINWLIFSGILKFQICLFTIFTQLFRILVVKENIAIQKLIKNAICDFNSRLLFEVFRRGMSFHPRELKFSAIFSCLQWTRRWLRLVYHLIPLSVLIQIQRRLRRYVEQYTSVIFLRISLAKKLCNFSTIISARLDFLFN